MPTASPSSMHVPEPEALAPLAQNAQPELAPAATQEPHDELSTAQIERGVTGATGQTAAAEADVLSYHPEAVATAEAEEVETLPASNAIAGQTPRAGPPTPRAPATAHWRRDSHQPQDADVVLTARHAEQDSWPAQESDWVLKR
jgi:hypothetical protein